MLKWGFFFVSLCIVLCRQGKRKKCLDDSIKFAKLIRNRNLILIMLHKSDKEMLIEKMQKKIDLYIIRKELLSRLTISINICFPFHNIEHFELHSYWRVRVYSIFWLLIMKKFENCWLVNQFNDNYINFTYKTHLSSLSRIIINLLNKQQFNK